MAVIQRCHAPWHPRILSPYYTAENLLLDTMFELPDMEGIQEVHVNKDTVEENKPPVYVFSDKKKKPDPKDGSKDGSKDAKKDKKEAAGK